MLGRARAATDGDKIANHRRARDLIKQLMSRPRALPFNVPVDHLALNIPSYTTIISDPMDLRTVQEKLRANNAYMNLLDFTEDVRLTFRNAMVFNPRGHFVATSAEILQNEFNQSLRDLMIEKTGSCTDMSALDSWLQSCILIEEKSSTVSTDSPRGKVIPSNAVSGSKIGDKDQHGFSSLPTVTSMVFLM